MFRILFLMIVLLIGLIAGPYLSGKQGYVLIETAQYNIEMSLTTLVIIFVVAMVIVYGVEWTIRRFCQLSNRTYGWFSTRKRRKAQKQTLEGLMQMNEGNYSKAEKLMGKNAKHADEPILNLVKAAEAAQHRGDEFAANHYLRQATDIAGEDNIVVELTRTRILLLQNKLPAARSAIDSLLEMNNKNQAVLKLAVEIYLKSHAYLALNNILDRIESMDLFPSDHFAEIRHQTEEGLLDEIMNEEGVEGLLSWWNAQSRRRRQDITLKIALIKRLIDCDDHESAYALTLEVLKKATENGKPLTELYAQLIRLQPVDNEKLIKLLEKRAKTVSTDQHDDLYRAIGYLHTRNGAFDKSAEAFKQVIDNKVNLTAQDITMANYVFEQNGETELAQKFRQDAVESVLSKPTSPTLDKKSV